MDRATFTIPALWADHHVLAVRDVLGALPGVSNIDASAMNKQVALDFDPAATSADAIAKALTAAGYAPGEIPQAPPAPAKKVAWNVSGYRVTVTNQADHGHVGRFPQVLAAAATGGLTPAQRAMRLPACRARPNTRSNLMPELKSIDPAAIEMIEVAQDQGHLHRLQPGR